MEDVEGKMLENLRESQEWWNEQNKKDWEEYIKTQREWEEAREGLKRAFIKTIEPMAKKVMKLCTWIAKKVKL